MRKLLPLLALAVLLAAPMVRAGDEDEERRRIVYVPSDQIEELLSRHERGVVLTAGEYLKLLDLARQSGLTPEPDPTADAVVLGGDLVGRVTGEKVLLTAVYRVRVLRDELVRVPFPLLNVAIGEVIADGKPAMVARDREGGFLLLKGRGDHIVTLDLAVGTARHEELRSFRIIVPAGTALRFDLLLPPGMEPLPGTAGAMWRAVVEKDGTRVIGHFFSGTNLGFAFRPKKDEGPRSTLLTGRGRVLHVIGARRLRTVALADIRIWRKGVAELTLAVPADLHVTNVTAPDLVGWTVTNGKVALRLKRPATGRIPVILTMEKSLPGPGDVALPEIRVEGASTETGVVGVRFEAGVAGRIVTSNGYVREPIPAAVRKQKKKRKGPPDPTESIVLAGSAAAYRYWSADRTLVAKTEAPEARVDADVGVVLSLTEEAQEVTARFSVTAHGERCFRIEADLPKGFELLDVAVESPVPQSWSREGEGPLVIDLPSGLAPKATVRVTAKLRLTSDLWRGDDWENAELPIPLLAPLVSGRIEGQFAVFANEEFDVKDSGLQGLKAEPVEMLGLPAARLGYRWRGSAAAGSLVVTRQQPKVTVRHVSIVAPGEKVAAFTGMLHYEIRRAGIRRFRFLVSGGLGDRLNVVTPDGSEPVRRTQEDGRDLWEITLPRKTQGEILIRFTLEEEMALADGARGFRFPEVTVLDVEDVTTWLAVESGDNMEVDVPEKDAAVAAGLREIGLEDMVLLGHKPTRGLLAAYQAAGGAYDLSIAIRRYEDMPVLAAFVRSARLTSVVARDGVVRTRAAYQILNADRQFLRVKLDESSTLWGAFVGGEAVKPSKGEDEYLIPLGTTDGNAATSVVLLLEGRGDELSNSGELALTAPTLVGVVGAEAKWEIVLPDEYRVTRTDGVFGAPRPTPPEPWLFRMLDVWTSNFGPRIMAQADSAGTAAPLASAVTDERHAVGKDAGDVTAAKPRPAAKWKEDEKKDRDETRRAPAEDHEMPEAESGEAEMDPADAPDAPPPAAAAMPGGPPSGGTPAKLPAHKRKGRVGALSIDVPLVPAGTHQVVRALGVVGSVQLSYVNEPARESLGTFLTWLTVVAGLILTGALKSRLEGFRVHPLFYVVLLGALATCAPAWFDVDDPTLWDGIARGSAITLALVGLASLVRFLARLGRPARTATTALLLLVLFAGAAQAGEEGETVYVPYDPAKIGELDGADRVFLPFSRFRELWNAAHPDRRIEKPEDAPVNWLLTSASYDGEPDGQTAKINAKYDLVILTDQWVEVPFGITNSVVEKATVDGKSVPVIAKKGAHVLVVRGKGEHRVEIALRTLIAPSRRGKTITMSLPSVPRTSFTFRVGYANPEVEFSGPVKPEVKDRTIHALLGPWGQVRMTWRPKSSAPTILNQVEVDTLEAVNALEGRVGLFHRSTWRVISGSITQATLKLPEGFELLTVGGGDVKSWTVTDGRLVVELAREVKDRTVIHLTFVRPDGSRTRKMVITGVEPQGVVREQGAFGVAGSRDLRLLVTDLENLDRIPVVPKRFAPVTSVPIHSAYRFLLRPISLTLSCEPVKSEIRVKMPQQFLITREWLLARATFTFDVRGDGTFEFPITLPEDVEIELVEGKGLERWWREGDTLTFSTASPVRGQFTVGIRFRRRLDPDATEVPLPELHAKNVTREQAWILVGHSPDLSLILVKDEGLIRNNVSGYRNWAKIANRQKNVFAYSHEGDAYEFTVARSFPKARLRPVATTRLIMEDDLVTVAVHVVYSIENAGEDTFKVFLPEGEGEDFLLAAARKRKVTLEKGELDGRPGRFLTVTLQQAAVGQYELRLAYDKKLDRSEGRKGQVEVAALVPIGDNPASWVLVENQSSGQVGWMVPKDGGLDEAEPTRFPFLPGPPFDVRQVLRGFRGKAAWSIGLDLTIHDFADFPDALVTSAEMVTAVGRDGWTRNRMTYMVLNRSRQFLEITMPDGSRLEAVRVGGRAVKPGTRQVAGETLERILVPLARMRPGDIATEVEIYWSRLLAGSGDRPLASLGATAVAEPVIHGLEVERTFFTLSLPAGLDYSFDGNMKPINEASRRLHALEEENRELGRLAQVSSLGSETQQVRSIDNYSRQRNKAEASKAYIRSNIEQLSVEDRNKYREVLRDMESNDRSVNANPLLLRANRGAQAGDKGKLDVVDEQTVALAKQLVENQKEQSFQYKGKKQVLEQGFARNFADPSTPGGQGPANQPAQTGAAAFANKALKEAAQDLAQQEDSPYSGPSRSRQIGIGGGAGGALRDRAAGSGEGAGRFSRGFISGSYSAAPKAKAGLLSLPVTVPMTGEIYRFEKLNGGAELKVDATVPGTGRGLTGATLFLLSMAILFAYFRFRPDARYAGFWPLMLAIGILVALFGAGAIGLAVIGLPAAAIWWVAAKKVRGMRGA